MKKKKWRDLRETLLSQPGNAARFEEARRRTEAEIVTYEQTLTELRRARAFTQAQLAKVLGVSQAQVSRIEHQSDLYLSTLETYIEAMGGRLELIATFGDVRLPLTLDDLTGRGEMHPAPEDTTVAIS